MREKKGHPSSQNWFDDAFFKDWKYRFSLPFACMHDMATGTDNEDRFENSIAHLLPVPSSWNESEECHHLFD